MRHCNEQSQSRLSISLVQQRHCERPRLAFSMALSNPTLVRFDSLMNYTSGPMSESMLISDFSVAGSWIYWFFSLVSNWFIFSFFFVFLTCPFLDIILFFILFIIFFFILFHSNSRFGYFTFFSSFYSANDGSNDIGAIIIIHIATTLASIF